MAVCTASRTREDILEGLRGLAPKLREEFGLASIDVFGSVARGEHADSSDIDILATFLSPPTYDQYFDLKFFLEDHFGRRVDLVTPGGIKPRLRKMIEADLVHVA